MQISPGAGHRLKPGDFFVRTILVHEIKNMVQFVHNVSFQKIKKSKNLVWAKTKLKINFSTHNVSDDLVVK